MAGAHVTWSWHANPLVVALQLPARYCPSPQVTLAHGRHTARLFLLLWGVVDGSGVADVFAALVLVVRVLVLLAAAVVVVVVRTAVRTEVYCDSLQPGAWPAVIVVVAAVAVEVAAKKVVMGAGPRCV